ncbi:MAG: hypothetical protein EOO20_03995 [Chryseobacterium sp.]|nr:MAG: hypothetical protein EOO20_03995 [Chryseobacterium sp.]
MYTTVKKLSKGLMAAALGLVLVFGGSAFKAENKRVQYKFRYNNPSDYSQGAVQTESNWIHDESAPECDGVLEQPCTILVDQNFVNTGSTPTLKTSLNITASATSSGFVTGSSDNTMVIENRTAQ